MATFREYLQQGCIYISITSGIASSALAGTWGTQQTIGGNNYQGSIAIDSTGNLTSAWLFSKPQNGGTLNEVLASTARLGLPWSAPVNVSGVLSNSGGNPVLSVNSSGTVTAVFTNSNATGSFADHPAGGKWTTPALTNGVNQFFASDEKGDQGSAWGSGLTRAGAGYTSISAVVRSAGGAWGSAIVLASGPHLALENVVMSPGGVMAVSWESFDAVCGSRVCNTSNWVLHVSTHKAGATNWVDSGAILGPDSSQHFGQLAADGLGDLGLLSLKGGNIVSLVYHGAAPWSAPVVVASSSVIGFYSGTGRDNRSYKADLAGHATFVNFSMPNLLSLLAIDGNLTTNTWGKPTTISGSDYPNYFDFAMSQSGASIVFYGIVPLSGSTTIWRAITRNAPTVPWNPPATAGTSFDGGGAPDSVSINDAAQAAVIFHGYSSDFLTYILYSNVYQP